MLEYRNRVIAHELMHYDAARQFYSTNDVQAFWESVLSFGDPTIGPVSAERSAVISQIIDPGYKTPFDQEVGVNVHNDPDSKIVAPCIPTL